MTQYISQPISVDRSAIRADQDTALVTAIPGLKIVPGTPFDAMSDVLATDSAELRQLITQQLLISFRAFSEKVDRVSQRQAVQAASTTSWTRSSTTGPRTVEAGTQIDVLVGDTDRVTFQTREDFTFDDGDATVAAVPIIAAVGGADGNGLSGPAQPTTTLLWLTSVTVDTPTSGGQDAETDDAFTNRMADTRPGRAFTIVFADDAARFARNQTGITRVAALDNYNPDTGDHDAGGHMTLIPVDIDGDPLIDDAMAALKLGAQAITVIGGIIHVIAPTYTTLAIEFTGVAEPGYDPDDVNALAENAVLDLINPATWGLPTSGDTLIWNETLTLYHQDVSTVLNNVTGFKRWTALTINGGTADIALAGPGALPDPDSTVVGTTTAAP